MTLLSHDCSRLSCLCGMLYPA